MADVRAVRAWAAATTAAAVPAALAVALAPLVFIAWPWARHRVQHAWRRTLTQPLAASGIVVTVTVSLVAAFLVERVTGLEPAASTSAMALAAGCACGGGLLVVWLLHRTCLSRPPSKRRSVWSRAIALAALAAWLAAVWQPVSLTLYFLHAAWLPESLLVMALVWGLLLLADTARWASLAVVPCGAAAVLLLIHHSRTELPNRQLTRLLRQRELSAHWLPWLSQRQEGVNAPTVAGSTCVPGVRPVASLGLAPEDAPDILFITIDGVSFRHTSFGDPKGNHTPRLLEHAKRAAVFTRAYTPAPWTRLAFRSLFTGLDPGLIPSPRSTKWGMSLAADQKTLAGYLKGGGYQTIALHSEPRSFPPQHNALLGFTTVDSQSRSFVQAQHYESSFKVNQTIAHLLELPKTAKPRFLWTHILDTHFPYSAGPGRSTAGVLEPTRHRMAVEFVDRELSRLLDFALAADRRDRTWVIITADHGEAFKEHGHHRHGYSVYEEELHVPLLIFGPNVVPRRIDTPVSTVTLTRTMLDAAGLRPPGHMCGESLLAALTSQAPLPAKPVFAATLPDSTTPDTFKLAWIDGHEKLIWSPAQGNFELYDLALDPGEKNNRADAHPQRTHQLAAGLRAYLSAQGRDPTWLTAPAESGAAPRGAGSLEGGADGGVTGDAAP